MTCLSEISDSHPVGPAFEDDLVDQDPIAKFVAENLFNCFPSQQKIDSSLETSPMKRRRVSISLKNPPTPVAEILFPADLFYSQNSHDNIDEGNSLSLDKDSTSNAHPLSAECNPTPSGLRLPPDILRDYLEKNLRENDILSAILVAKNNNAEALLVEIAQSLLNEAISNGNSSLVASCLEIEININRFDKNGLTPLLLALLTRNRTIIEQLIKKGADVTIGHEKFPKRSLAVYASLFNIKDFEDLLVLTKHDRQMIAHTQASLSFGISTKEVNYFANSMAFNSYISEITDDSDMKKAFTKAAHFNRNFRDDLKQDDIVILNSGPLDHAISLVFARIKDQDILAVCNRGIGSCTDDTIRYYRVDRAKFNDDCQRQLLEIEKQETFTPECAEFYYTTLPLLLHSDHGSSIEIELLSRLYQPKLQKSGNCIVASSKAAAGAIFAIKTYESFAETLSLEHMQQKTRLLYKEKIGLPLRSYLMDRLHKETEGDDAFDEFKRLISNKLISYQIKVILLLCEQG